MEVMSLHFLWGCGVERGGGSSVVMRSESSVVVSMQEWLQQSKICGNKVGGGTTPEGQTRRMYS